MNAVSPKAAARTVTAVALAAGLAVCMSAGAAQANPTAGAPDRLGSGKDRVILQAPSSKAAAASLSLSSPAPRVAGGAVARVTASYNCPAGTDGYLDIRLVEVTGSVVAQGYGSNAQPLRCDGATRKVNINVVVSNDYPFKKGTGFAQGFLYAASETVEATDAVERTISIT